MSQINNQPPRDANAESTLQADVLQWVRRILLNNWPLKLLSLVLALALWSGLIMQDPTLTREKTFRDVNVAVNNTDILKRNGYVVTTDLDALLQHVDMTVDVPQMQHAQAQPVNYNIRVDLNRLEKRAGEQEISILTTDSNTYGSVTRVSPSTITVMVEEYVTLNFIPVNLVCSGKTPDGFYALGVTHDPEWITISGPRSLVERVERAEVELDMSALPAREGLAVRSLPFTLLDEAGSLIESDMLQVTHESVLRERVNVSVTLYACREIPILEAGLYSGVPADGYEVTDAFVSPSSITVVGQRSVIDKVNLLQTSKSVSIDGAADTVTATIDLNLPLNLQWMSENKATVTVVILPRQSTAVIQDVPVRLAGLPEGWTAALDQPTAQVRVTGDEVWVERLTAEDVALTCEVSNLAPGEHEVAVSCEIIQDDGHAYILETEPETVTVTVTAAGGTE